MRENNVPFRLTALTFHLPPYREDLSPERVLNIFLKSDQPAAELHQTKTLTNGCKPAAQDGRGSQNPPWGRCVAACEPNGRPLFLCTPNTIRMISLRVAG